MSSGIVGRQTPSWIMDEYVHTPRRKRAARVKFEGGRFFRVPYNNARENDRRLRRRSYARGPLAYGCPSCGAHPDQPCLTPSGAQARQPHKARV